MFEGYLIKFGDKILPATFMCANSYTVTPNQRGEIEAWRDSNYLLHRDTSVNYKTKIDFNTVDALNLGEKQQMQAIMKAGCINEVERKHRVTYWNDEDNEYKTMECYIPDIDYPIRRIIDDTGNKDIIYNKIRIALIEY